MNQDSNQTNHTKQTKPTKQTQNTSHPKGKYAWTVKVGEKGQFVIPKEARDLFHINPGDTLLILGDEKKGIAIPPKQSLSELMSNIFMEQLPPEEIEEGGDAE
ncbi:MAG: AbrB/MazE/SpoVT family DNA-binding domain-containing protein [Clostridia bacterium]|nr:AbrB/MazE/SpoVT family DNA-binding domain-containing protein [Clostridia bacterium]